MDFEMIAAVAEEETSAVSATMQGGAIAPIIAYAGSPFSWTSHTAISTANVTSTGGAITSYAVHSGTLPTGVSLNTSTGAITGTPTDSGTSPVTIRATGAGGTGDATITFTVWMPTSISGLVSWYDFADITTLYTDSARTTPVAADNDLIGGVTNKSTDARHLSGSGVTRPSYKANIQNGKSVARYDGGDVLTLTAAALSAFTVFVVFKATANSTRGVFEYRASGSVGFRIHNDYSSSTWETTITYYSGAGEGLNRKLASLSLPTSYLVDVFKSNTTARRNGADATLSSATAGWVTTAYGLVGQMAGYASLAGDIAEIILYDSLLSAGNVSKVEAYLNAKWAVY